MYPFDGLVNLSPV